MVSGIGVAQLLAFGSTLYLLAVLAGPIAADTGWASSWVVGGLSLGLVVSGVLSPLVGRLIAARGGRVVLAASAVLLAAGLATLAAASVLPVYLLAWAVIGMGMAAGLYTPAFSALGQLYGVRARAAITTVTLFGALASTVSWPLTAAIESQLGWRAACLIWAGVHLVVTLPVYLTVMRTGRGGAADAVETDGSSGEAPSNAPPRTARSAERQHAGAPASGTTRALLIALMTIVGVVGSANATIYSVHILSILQGFGLTLAAAVALGAVVGPAQLASRFLDLLLARRFHPVWTMVASCCLSAAGFAALLAQIPYLALALVLFGAGLGLGSIAAGTVPLAVFGPVELPRIAGLIAAPTLVAQAAAPLLGSWLLDAVGNRGTLAVLTATSAASVVATLALVLVLRRSSDRAAR